LEGLVFFPVKGKGGCILEAPVPHIPITRVIGSLQTSLHLGKRQLSVRYLSSLILQIVETTVFSQDAVIYI